MARGRVGAMGLVTVLLVACSGSPDAPAGSSASVTGTPSQPHGPLTMTTARAVQHATRLGDGRVLLTGGCTSPGCGGFARGGVSEFYDPRTRRFAAGPRMTVPRASNTATVLQDGRVLLAGGFPAEGQPAQPDAEIFDPGAGTFTAVGSMGQARADQSATLLPDGRVLMAGGTDGRGPLDSTEYFDPGTGEFSPGPALTSPRSAHAAVLLRGEVVLVGGTADGLTAIGTTDVLRSGVWGAGPTLRQARIKHGAALLADGVILVIGGATTTEGRRKLRSTELLDVRTGTSRRGPPLSEGEYKLDGAVATIPDGRVVIAGGTRIDVYDPATNAITVLAEPSVPQYSFVTATPLDRRTVLVAGGYDRAITPTARARLVRVPEASGNEG